MKKKRLISWLLTAALTLSSMPMMASNVTADEPTDTNLLANVTPTVVGTGVVKTDLDAASDGDTTDWEEKLGDNYLRVYDRGRNKSSAGLSIYYPANMSSIGEGETWYLTFDARVPVESNYDALVRTRNQTQNQQWWSAANKDAEYAKTNLKNFDADRGIKMLRGWQTYTLVFDPGKITNFTGNYLTIRDGYTTFNDPFHQPFDIDNIEFYVMKDGVKVEGKGVSYNFEDGIIPDSVKAYEGSTISVASADIGSFTRITGKENNNISVTYDLSNIQLVPGMYDVGGLVRFAYFDGRDANDAVGSGESRNVAVSTDVDVKVKINGEYEPLASLTNVKDVNWTEIKDAAFPVYDGDVVTELVITTDTCLAVDFNDITLTKEPANPIKNVNKDLLANVAPTFVKTMAEGFTDVESSNGNAYLSVYDATTNDYGFNINAQDIYDKLDDGETLYISFDARMPVESNYSSRVRCRAYGVTDGELHYFYPETTPEDWGIHTSAEFTSAEWVHYELKRENAKAGTGTSGTLIRFKSGYSASDGDKIYHQPYDIDNIRIYTEDRSIDVTYDFENSIPDNIVTYNGASIKRTEARDFNRVRSGGSNKNTIKFEDVAVEPGVYLFTGAFRSGEYLTASALDDVENSASITIKIGDDTVASGTVKNNWVEFTSDKLVFSEAATVDITITSDDAAPIDYTDVSFKFVDDFESVLRAESNLLDGVTMTTSPAVVEDIESKGYLNTAQRDEDTNSHFIEVSLPVQLKADTKYYLSFDVKTTNGEATAIRPYVEFGIKENSRGPSDADPTVNTTKYVHNYFLPTSNSLRSSFDAEYHNSKAYNKQAIVYDVNGTWDHFEGYLTPDSDTALTFIINRGVSGDEVSALDFDNFKVWYYEGAKEVYLYENDFAEEPEYSTKESDRPYSLTSKGADFDCKVPVTVMGDPEAAHTLITPAEDTAVVISYNTADIKVAAGTYKFITDISSASYAGKAKVIFYINGNPVTGKEITVKTDRYTELSYSVELSDGDVITKIELVTEIEGAVKLSAPALIYKDTTEDVGFPSVGIIMVMLAKKRAAAEAEAGGSAIMLTVDGKRLSTKSYTGDSANKYLQVYNSNINTNGISIVHNGLAAGDYTLEFDIRQTVEVQPVGALDFVDNAGGDVIRIRENYGDKATTYVDFNEDGSWKHVKYTFHTDGAKAYQVDIYGGTNQNYSMPFEVDNIVVKDSKGNTVYTQDFNALDTAVYDGEFSIDTTAEGGAAFTFKNRSKGSDYALAADESYVSATVGDNAVVTYDLGDTVLEAGDYVIKGSIRNGFFDGTTPGKALASLDEALASDKYLNWLEADADVDGETVGKGLFVVNKNKMTVKVSATVGETVNVADYTVASNWTDFEVKFTVTEGAVPVITLTLDHDMPYTINGKDNKVPFDLKNVEIVAAQ